MHDRYFANFVHRLLCGAGVLIVLTVGPSLAQSDPQPTPPSGFHFVAFGDMPYRVPADFERLENLIAGVNQDKPVFTVHVGDIKNGLLNCSTDYYLTIRSYFDSFDGPLVYTPGDNDWADCDRILAGGYDTRERLAELRQVFFADTLSMGSAPISLTRQSDGADHSEMTENATWSHGGVTFATVHMVGADNNLGDDRKEFDQRNDANIDWIKTAFRAAVENNSKGVVLMFHADIFSAHAPRASFADAKAAIAEGAELFDRPVLLVNGDAHTYGTDNPVRRPETGETNPKVTRLIVFGSAKMHAVRITIDPASSRLFTIEPLIINKNLVD